MSPTWSLASLFRREPPRDGAEAPRDAPDPTGSDHVVEAYLASGPVELLLHAPAGRLTDLLNQESVTGLRARGGGDPPSLDDLLVVVPPAHTSDRQRRLHRPGRGVLVQIGPYEVIGDAHVPPGAQATGFLIRTNPRFAPLTNVTIRSPQALVAERHVEVAIVSLQRADRFRDLTPDDHP